MYLTTCSWERAACDVKVHAWIASCNGNTVIHYYMRISHNAGLPGSERGQTDCKQPNSEPNYFDGISSCNISLAGNSSNGSLPCKSTGHVGHVWSSQKGWQLETSINKKTVKYKIKESYINTGLFVISIHPTDTRTDMYIIYIYIHTHIIIEPYEYIIIYNYIPTEIHWLFIVIVYIYICLYHILPEYNHWYIYIYICSYSEH